MCENRVRGGGLLRDRKVASWRLAGLVRPQGAWLVRELRGALRKGVVRARTEFPLTLFSS